MIFALAYLSTFTLFKSIKYFIDSKFRKSVIPIEGSVVYSPLYASVEHSGIYIGREKISNIVVDSLLNRESTVRLSSASEFTDSSWLGNKIYVSCDRNGNPVGNEIVTNKANAYVGERCFYGLIYSNCHSFSMKCLEESPQHYVSEQKTKVVIISLRKRGFWL